MLREEGRSQGSGTEVTGGSQSQMWVLWTEFTVLVVCKRRARSTGLRVLPLFLSQASQLTQRVLFTILSRIAGQNYPRIGSCCLYPTVSGSQPTRTYMAVLHTGSTPLLRLWLLAFLYLIVYHREPAQWRKTRQGTHTVYNCESGLHDISKAQHETQETLPILKAQTLCDLQG